MNLEGKCVGLDNRGVCDTSLATVQGVFVANNGLGKCDGRSHSSSLTFEAFGFHGI